VLLSDVNTVLVHLIVVCSEARLLVLILLTQVLVVADTSAATTYALLTAASSIRCVCLTAQLRFKRQFSAVQVQCCAILSV
jgi:hypothetical protein